MQHPTNQPASEPARPLVRRKRVVMPERVTPPPVSIMRAPVDDGPEHSSAKRSARVVRGFVRFFVMFLLEEAVLRAPLVRTLWGKKWKRRNPERLRQFALDMGGAFIKFGQFFSMRSDILPPAYCNALRSLYDEVPPFPASEARRIIERELQAQIDELFESFDDDPVGAASFGQAHLVVLKRGESAGKSAVIKVSRPGSEKQIATDTRLLMLLGYLVDTTSLLGQIKLAPIFRDFARWIRREVAYMQEAKNADHLHEVTDWNVRQRVPFIHWDYTTNRVLTMEYLQGIPISELITRLEAGDETLDEELEAMDCSRLVVARNLYQSFMLQAFVGHVFHADPHPGNLIVLPQNTVGFVDFGLLGRLNEEGRREQLLALDAVVQENIESLFVSVLDIMDAPRGLAVTDVYDDFAEEADEWLDACDNPGALMKEKTLARFVDSIMAIARQVGLVLPMQTMLYYKALLTIDGVVLRVYPDFDYKTETRRACAADPHARARQDARPGLDHRPRPVGTAACQLPAGLPDPAAPGLRAGQEDHLPQAQPTTGHHRGRAAVLRPRDCGRRTRPARPAARLAQKRTRDRTPPGGPDRGVYVAASLQHTGGADCAALACEVCRGQEFQEGSEGRLSILAPQEAVVHATMRQEPS